MGHSTANLELDAVDKENLARYLDMTRAEILFSRGGILVEGDAEKFLVPVFAKNLEHDLDRLGVSVYSVSGTNFAPYAKLLSTLNIPFAVITNWDPQLGDRPPLGVNRAYKLAQIVAKKTWLNKIKNTYIRIISTIYI